MLRILVNTMKKWSMPLLVIWKVVAKRDFLHVFRYQDFRYTQGDCRCSAFGILNSDVAVRSKALAVTVYFSMILDPFHVNLDLWPSIRMYGCWKKITNPKYLRSQSKKNARRMLYRYLHYFWQKPVFLNVFDNWNQTIISYRYLVAFEILWSVASVHCCCNNLANKKILSCT